MQLGMFASTAQELRDSGMEQAAQAQEAATPGFAAAAFDLICWLARRQRTIHVDDVLAAGIHPSHPNAWGAVWMRAIRSGVLSRGTELRPCRTDPGKHHHQYPVYHSRIYREVA